MNEHTLPPRPCRPAIVGVCKRWARVHWGSPQLWRHVTVSAAQLEQPPIALRPDAPLRMFAEHEREHQRRREAGWQAAKRAQLQRVGHLAEAATFSGRVPPALLSALLHRLHPAALRDLELPPHLSEEQAFILAGFTQLTRLATNAGVELSSILPRLAKLQHLTLARGQVSTQLMNALQSLAALTCLVSAPPWYHGMLHEHLQCAAAGIAVSSCRFSPPLPHRS